MNNLFSIGELVWDSVDKSPALVVNTYSIVADAGTRSFPVCDLYSWARPALAYAVPQHELTPLTINNIKKLRDEGYLSNS